MAKAINADKGAAIDALAADSTYIDDGVTGGTKDEVERMAGNLDKTGIKAQILSPCGFTAKVYVMGGQCTEEEAETLRGKFLGISYGPILTKFWLIWCKPFLQKKKRNGIGKETAPYNAQVIKELRGGTALTKRQCLTFLMAQ